MTGLDLDEIEERHFLHGATGYGVEICGGTAEEREATLKKLLEGPFTTVDCRDLETSDDVVETILADVLGINPAEIDDDRHLGTRDAERVLAEAGNSLLLLEFDSLSNDAQTDVARSMKGIAEGRQFDRELGYSVAEGGSVVRAEPDLRMRVRSWDID